MFHAEGEVSVLQVTVVAEGVFTRHGCERIKGLAAVDATGVGLADGDEAFGARTATTAMLGFDFGWGELAHAWQGVPSGRRGARDIVARS